MKTKLKKSLAVFVAVMLLVSTVSMLELSALTVDSVNIALTTPKVNSVYNSATNAGTVITDNTCDASIAWYDADINLLSDGQYFLANTTYAPRLKIVAKSGNNFTENTSVTLIVNGEHKEVNLLDRNPFDYGFIELEVLLKLPVDTYLYNISLTDVPTVTVGNTPTAYNYTHTEGGKQLYTVTGEWFVYSVDGGILHQMLPTDTFEADKNYQLMLTGTLSEDIAFNEHYTEFYVNGNYIDNAYHHENTFSIPINYFSGTPISDFELDESIFPTPKIGESFSDATLIKLTSPKDSHITIEGNWRDEEWNTNGTFQKNKVYYFDYTLIADAGYYFMDTYVNIGNNGNYISNSLRYRNEYRISFKTKIDTVELLDLPDIAVGKKVKTGVFPISVPKDAPYTAQGTIFDLETYAPITQETIEAKKGYDLTVEIFPKENYEFEDEIIIKSNTGTAKTTTNYTYACYARSYKFYDYVEKLEITGIKEPKAGEAATVDTLKPVHADQYEITNAYWYIYDSEHNEIPVTNFQGEKRYFLKVEVNTKGHYKLHPETLITFNGESYIFADPYEENCVWLQADFSLQKEISEIHIDGIPTMKIGEKANNELKLTIDNSANYTASLNWETFVIRKGFEIFNGVFQNDTLYTLNIRIDAKEGYTFTENTKAYFNGEAVDIETNGEYAFYRHSFTNGLKVIERVDIKIDKPQTDYHTSFEPTVTIENGADYKLAFAHWLKEAHGDFYMVEDHYFIQDGKYGAQLNLIANEGYVFSDKLVVVVNNTALSDEYFSSGSFNLNIDYLFSAKCKHIYTDNNDDTCDACGEKRQLKSPATADNAYALMFTVIALGALAIIAHKKIKTN